MRYGLIITLVTTLSLGTMASDYYQKVFLREIDFENYQGPLDPRLDIDYHAPKIEFQDENLYPKIITKYTSEEAIGLSTFWFKHIATMKCPHSFLGQNIDYIRYLFRLVTISYLYEVLKDYHVTLYRLGGSGCSLNWNDSFGKCTPQSHDMQLFLKRIEGRHLKTLDRNNMVKMNSKKLKRWVRGLKRSCKKKRFRSITEKRVADWARKQGLPCGSLSVGQVRAALTYSCKDDKKILFDLCSERDGLYGISYAPAVRDILKKANTLNVINQGGFGQACLERYVDLFEDRERVYPTLKSLFSMVNKKLKREKKGVHGALFLSGALKEFDDKGLDDFLIWEPTPIPVPTLIPTPVPTATPVPTPTPTPVPTPVPTATPVPTPTPRTSEFSRAVIYHKAKKLKVYEINMTEFRKDFVYTSAMIKAIDKKLKVFQTRAALSQMKKREKLGTKKYPLTVKFVKYLIDNNLHQGLYNIKAVIGSKFYIENDIDGIKAPVYVELVNDDSTKNKWVIRILKDPPLKSKAKKKSKKKNRKKK